MTTLLIIVWGTLALLLILASAIQPERSPRSWFELKRRSDDRTMRREKLLEDIYGTRRAVAGLLLILLTVIGFFLWHALGVVAVAILWLVSGFIARQKFMRRPARQSYLYLEPWLLDVLESTPFIGRIVRTQDWKPHDQKLESTEQLIGLIDSSNDVLTSEQQRVIRHGIDWHTKPVKDAMTPKNEIVTIKRTELLGPLVLDDLYKSGHSCFPVVKDNLDSIVGVLDISSLREISANKRSDTAEKAMLPQVQRIEEGESLSVALSLIIKSHQHLLIVVNKRGETLGVITLNDITEFLR